MVRAAGADTLADRLETRARQPDGLAERRGVLLNEQREELDS
jgi:hypothetical protein